MAEENTMTSTKVNTSTPTVNPDIRRCFTWQHLERLLLPSAARKHKYSIERFAAFDEYRRNSSPWWILFVILATPLPSMLIMTALNYVPLDPIEKGWKENPMCFIRAFFTAVISMTALRSQRKFYIAGVKTSFFQNIIVTLSAALMCVAIMVGFAATIAFPTPFSILVGFITPVPFIIILVFIIFRKNHKKNKKPNSSSNRSTRLEQITQNNDQAPPNEEVATAMKKYKRILIFNFMLIFIYPIFAIGFRNLENPKNPLPQMLYTLILPVLKIVLGRFARKLCGHIEDVAAESSVFTVSFFNALFVSMCMGGSNSKETSLFMMTLDLIHIGFAMVRFGLSTKKLIKGRKQAFLNSDQDIISQCLNFAHQNQQTLQQLQHENNIRWKSSNGLSFRQTSMVLRLLNKAIKRVPTVRPLPHMQQSIGKVLEHTNRVVPSPTTAASGHKVPLSAPIFNNGLTNPDQQRKVDVLSEMLSVIFAMEHVLLVEYVEAFIPYVYTFYVAATYASPNREYFVGMENKNEDEMHQSIQNMLMYGTMELFSLLLLFVLVYWRFHLNVFQLLAFVLETHFFSIQGKLFFFLTVIFNFNIRHFGMDFSFQFQWLEEPWSHPSFFHNNTL